MRINDCEENGHGASGVRGTGDQFWTIRQCYICFFTGSISVHFGRHRQDQQNVARYVFIGRRIFSDTTEPSLSECSMTRTLSALRRHKSLHSKIQCHRPPNVISCPTTSLLLLRTREPRNLRTNALPASSHTHTSLRAPSRALPLAQICKTSASTRLIPPCSGCAPANANLILKIPDPQDHGFQAL